MPRSSLMSTHPEMPSGRVEVDGNANSNCSLDELRARANQVADESVESTRRMLSLCEQSQEAGSRTLGMLHHQAEQLDRVEKNMDSIEQDMKHAERHLLRMEKWCGLCLWPFRKSQPEREQEGYDEVDSGPAAVRSGNGDAQPTGHRERGQTSCSVIRQQPAGRSETSESGGNFIQRITNDAREDEMEQNMQAVGSMLSTLRNMAVDMGQEIEHQNHQLDSISSKAQAADVRVRSANQRTDKLLAK